MPKAPPLRRDFAENSGYEKLREMRLRRPNCRNSAQRCDREPARLGGSAECRRLRQGHVPLRVCGSTEGSSQDYMGITNKTHRVLRLREYDRLYGNNSVPG